jgi:hypothetical protein
MSELTPQKPNPETTEQASPPKQPKVEKRKRQLPSSDQLAWQLLSLNGGLMMGQISASDGNLVHKNIKAVMDLQSRKEGQVDKPQTPDGLVEACRKDPSLLNTIESFLTEEQLDNLMKQIAADA